MIQYQVQYKPINPITNSPVTNKTSAQWNGTYDSIGSANPNYDMMFMFVKTKAETVKVQSGKASIKTDATITLNKFTPSEKYYASTGSGSIPPLTTLTGRTDTVITGEVVSNTEVISSNGMITTDLKRIETDVWAVYCVKESIKAAMKASKPLIQQYGIENVQICKVVQANIEVVFEE